LDTDSKKTLPGWLPYFTGALFVVLFLSLGFWQVARGFQKQEIERLFAAQTGYVSWSAGMDVKPFQRLKASGHFDSRHQFLLENIILNTRPGYNVVTPLDLGDSEPVLLVNRGWVSKLDDVRATGFLDVDEDRSVVRGRAGHLPQPGFKMGEGVAPGQQWPKLAVFPDYGEIAAALGREVYPLVLLLDPQDEYGFVREWQPPKFGPGRHFAYAFQWFVMGTVLAGLLVRSHRRRGLEK
jgi:surfeit locus 1 family protein